MAIRLTKPQQRALDLPEAQPLQVVDPRTNAAYVLIPLLEYEAVREIVEDERRQRSIRAVALRNAGRRADESLDLDPEVEAAWEREADRREAELESGAVAAIPGHEALVRLRSRLSNERTILKLDSRSEKKDADPPSAYDRLKPYIGIVEDSEGSGLRGIDFSQAKRGPVVSPEPGKTKISIQLDDSVIEAFRAMADRAGGGSYQTLINDALVAHLSSSRA